MTSFIWFQISFTEIFNVYTVLNIRPFRHGVYKSAKTYISVNWESSCSFSKKGFIKPIRRKSVSYPAIIYYACYIQNHLYIAKRYPLMV